MKKKYIILSCLIVITLIAGLLMIFTVNKSFSDFDEYTEPNIPDDGWKEDVETKTVVIDGVEYEVNINN